MRKTILNCVVCISVMCGVASADAPMDILHGYGWTRTLSYIHSGCHYDDVNLRYSTGTGAILETITLTQEEAYEATASASASLGLSAQTVASATIGVQIGWKQTLADSWQWYWGPGVEYIWQVLECTAHHKGTIQAKDVGPCYVWTCYCEQVCGGQNSHYHYHTDSFSARKGVGVHKITEPNPTDPPS